MEPKKYAYIDSLRGIAILLVMLVHVGQISYLSQITHGIKYQLIDNGQLGVQLFFLVSAFTLMRSMQSRHQEPHAKRNFFIRRFFRIAPMYYVAILYYTFQNFIGFNFFATGNISHSIPFIKLFANLFFIHGFYPTTINSYVPGGWSIAVEMTFYLFLPLIFSKIKTINHSLLFVFSSLLVATFFHSLLKAPIFGHNNFIDFNFINQLPMFSLGILAYFFLKKDAHHLSPAMLLLVALSLLFFSYFSPPYYLLYGVAWLFLLLGLSKLPIKALVNKPIEWIGKLSFSLYLIHFAAIYWITQWIPPSIFHITHFTGDFLLLCGYYLLTVLSSISIAYFTYRFIEVPFQHYGKNLITKMK
jgi:peptidoglycan/LPS O-acetylase OafA/YrhL